MNLVKMVSVAVGLATWVVFLGSTALAQSPPSPKPFLVFDGTLYSNKPDLSVYGIRPITMVYAGKFGPDWYKHADRLPDLQAVQAVAHEAQQKGHRVVLDIEHWPLKGSPDSVHDSLTKYMTVLEWFRAAAPDLSVGYYGVPPIRDYWRAIKDPSNQERRSWMVENDQIRALASAVDVLFPHCIRSILTEPDGRNMQSPRLRKRGAMGMGNSSMSFCGPYHESNRILGVIFCLKIIGYLNWKRPNNTPMALSSGVDGVATIVLPNGMKMRLGGGKRRSLWRPLVLLLH